MPIGSTAWGVVLPVEQTNLLLNSSFERGTSGVAAIQGATLGSASNKQQFGAWSCFVVPGSNGTSGGAFGTWTAGNGTDYTVSAYVNGQNGIPYMIGVGDSNGVNLVGSAAFTGGGTWQRYSYSYTEASGAVRRVVIRKTSGNNQGTYYADGVDAVAGSITTHIDGDQEGCTWLGAPHASQSTRSGQSRAGGSVVALADLGFTVADQPGIGMPPVENSAQSFAVVPGAEFQRQRAGVRAFTLTSYVSGTSRADLHITRDRIIDALKIDAVTPQQPCRFLYTGGLGTVQIDAVYDAGLEYGKPGGFTEDVTVRFVAYDPYWKSTTDEGTSLAPRVSIGSANHIVKRDSLGRWGTLGAAGVTTNNQIQALAVGTDGVVYLSGLFTTVGGTSRPYVGQYSPLTNAFGTLVGGTPNSFVRSLAINPQGSLILGGTFNQLGGTTVGYIGFWAGNYGTFGSLSGDANTADGVKALAWSRNGTLYAGGDFVKANGTSTFYAALYGGAAWGSLAGQPGGTINGNIYGMSVGFDDTLYFCGAFGSAGGTKANFIAMWNGAFGTMGVGADNLTYSVGSMPDGRIAVGGIFGSLGSIYAPAIGVWNGVSFAGMGSGLTNTTQVIKVLPLPDGRVVAVGAFSRSGAILFPDAAAIFTGYSWLPLDIDLQQVQQINDAAYGKDASLYIAGSFTGTAQAASVAQIMMSGAAETYPIFYARNTATSGTARIYQLLNTLTGDNLYFNYALQAGEEVTLDLTPGDRSFTSSFQGNIFGKILPGSNIATWKLAPGTNYVSLFSDSDNLVTSLYWRPRHWSADGGTVYA